MHRLITIVFSHYVEKARWGLERAGLAYREEAYMPGMHFPGVALRVLGRGVGERDAASSRFSTPLLIPPSGPPISGSARILRYCDERLEDPSRALYFDEEAAELERRFDDDFGAHTRRVAYFLLLRQPEVLHRMARENVGPAQARLFRLAYPVFGEMLRRGLRIHERAYLRSREKVEEQVRWVEERLADGRPYLLGDRFSAADLCFAALYAPAYGPRREEGWGSYYPAAEELDAETLAIYEDARARPAGQFALRILAEERLPSLDRGRTIATPLGAHR